MSIMTPFQPQPSRSARHAQAAGALASSALTLGALFVLFHHAAPAHWRADAAVLQAAAAECRAIAQPVDRSRVSDGHLRCMDEVLARRAGGGEHVALADAR